MWPGIGWCDSPYRVTASLPHFTVESGLTERAGLHNGLLAQRCGAAAHWESVPKLKVPM